MRSKEKTNKSSSPVLCSAGLNSSLGGEYGQTFKRFVIIVAVA